MTEPLLSVQLIVRNEELLLPFCLASIKGIADEIVVVDTGSTDRTVELALSYGARVYAANWTDDFAYARNIGLDRTEAKWILCLDADEVLAAGADSLRGTLQTTSAEAFWVTIDNVLGRLPEERLQHRMVRLFRNRPERRFRQRLHEQILPAILERSGQDTIAPSNLKLTHLGYFHEIKDQTDKQARNERILAAMLAETPDDPFALYNWGVAKAHGGDQEQALQAMMTARSLAPPAIAYRPGLVRDIARLLLAMERPNEAGLLLAEESGNYPDYPDLHYLLGEAYRAQGLLPEALQALRQAAACPSDSALYPVEAGCATFRAQTLIGDTLTKLGQLEEAKSAYEQALASHAAYKPATLGWAASLEALRIPGTVIAERLLLLVRDLPSGLLLFAEAMLHIGHYRELLNALDDAAKHPQEPALTQHLAYAHLHLGHPDKAIEQLRPLLESDQTGTILETVRLLALAAWSGGAAIKDEWLWVLPHDERRHLLNIERRLWQRAQPAASDQQEDVRSWIDRAVRAGLLEVAKQLAGSDAALRPYTARCLYRAGYVHLASGLLLNLLEEERLDGDAAADLAELLYDRGHYGEAAPLFELAVPAASDRARIGAALSYLHNARSVLHDALYHHPDSPLLRGDLHKTTASLELLGKLDWHTPWTPAQRRNADVRTPNFLVHDRER
ncbi:glycosyltransferase family 2 protein [Paenibacillus methanolicus]|uniref:Tetratricopeptide repeat protein n=1 Tax=Paenibacillus methanolicus TaxID=582686 RepID=A0A5S5CAA6_9BACL|nr:glycosyltransferase family 2 protein [Paenibacillus methanolicus]TYP76341.1 tetratricopeptide repeat protein [Paenibacillus methanolicus]